MAMRGRLIIWTSRRPRFHFQQCMVTEWTVKNMYGLLLWFFCCLAMAKFCSSSAVIEIRLVRFNSSGLLSLKKCCDSPSLSVCPINQCDPQLFFCLQDFSGHGCPLGNVSTGYTSDSDSIIFSDVIGDARTPNPMVLHVENYPGVVIAKVTIYDYDKHEGATANEKMDYSQYVYSFEPDTNGTRHNASLIPLVGSTSTLDVEISVHCDLDYYGSKCDVKCISDLFRYCDRNGVLLCRPGKICAASPSTPVRTTPIPTKTMTTSVTSTFSSTLSTIPLPPPTTLVNTVPYSDPTNHMTSSRIHTATAFSTVAHSPVTSKLSQFSTMTSKSSQFVSLPVTSKLRLPVSTLMTPKPSQTVSTPEMSKTSQAVPTSGISQTSQTVSISETSKSIQAVSKPDQSTVTSFYQRTSTDNVDQTNSTTDVISLHQKPSFTLIVKARGSTTESLQTIFEGHKCIFNASDLTVGDDSLSLPSRSFSALGNYLNEIIRTEVNESRESVHVDVQEAKTEDGKRQVTLVLIDNADGSSINTSRLIDIARTFCSQVTARAYQIAKGEKADELDVVVPSVVCGVIAVLGFFLTYFLCRRKCKNRKIDIEHKAEIRDQAKQLNNSKQ